MISGITARGAGLRARAAALILGVLVSGGLALQQEVVAQDVFAAPHGGTGTLVSPFSPDPLRVDLVPGGGIDAFTSVSSHCAGYISTAPDYRLYYTAGGSLPLHLYVRSPDDTTLVVSAPNGDWYCNDDTDGLNPALYMTWPQSGQYDIWIGRFGTTEIAGSATLYISEYSDRRK